MRVGQIINLMIPNEIVPLLYHRLINDKLYDQAENLRTSYYNILAIRLDDHKVLDLQSLIVCL